jgi:hypothetical protein
MPRMRGTSRCELVNARPHTHEMQHAPVSLLLPLHARAAHHTTAARLRSSAHRARILWPAARRLAAALPAEGASDRAKQAADALAALAARRLAASQLEGGCGAGQTGRQAGRMRVVRDLA